MSIIEPSSPGKGAAPSQQSLLALSWLNFFLAGMQTAFGPVAAAYLVSVAKPHFATQDRDFSGEMGAVLADQTVAGYHRCRSFPWRSRISNREGATVPRLAYLCSNAFKRLVVGPTIVSSARTQSSANC